MNEKREKILNSPAIQELMKKRKIQEIKNKPDTVRNAKILVEKSKTNEVAAKAYLKAFELSPQSNVDSLINGISNKIK